MNKSCVVFILFNTVIALFATVSGQGQTPEFGKIEPSDLAMKECPFEKTAGAMNLAKLARINFEINLFTGVPIITTQYFARIKIFDKRGFSAADIKIPYVSNSRSSKIKDLEAYIYTLDAEGKLVRTKVEKKEIFTGKSKERHALNYLAFTFPNLKEGAVIEYRYTKIDKNSVGIKPWFFQDEIPTAFSRISVVVPAYVAMDYHVLSSDPIEKDSAYKKFYRTDFNESTRSFTLRNIHSFRVEPLMTSLKDNLERVEFSISPANFFRRLFTSSQAKWGLFNYFMLNARFFGYQFDKPIPGTAAFTDSVKKISRVADRIGAVYAYVEKNVEWNEEQTFYCDSIAGCWLSKSGSSAEINILFLNLLRTVGVKCYPILASTRDNGNPDIDFPSLSQFNGVDIVVMDSSTTYTIDCTQKQLSFRIPPLNILNSYAYLVDEEKFGWIFVTDPRTLMKNEISMNASMDSAGSIEGKITLSFIGFAKSARLDDRKQKEDERDTHKSDNSANMPDLVIDTAFSEPDKDGSDTLVENLGFHFALANTDKFYFLNPFAFSAFEKNPFKDSLRFTDIDFGCNQSFHARLRIKIPGIISIESMPADISLQKQDSSIFFGRKIRSDGGFVVIDNSFILKNAVFIKEDYPALKAFFDKFYALLNEEIVLKKKN
jgi:hypothetical protein